MGSEAANHFFDFANVLLFLLAAVGFIVAALVAGSFLRRDRYDEDKMRIYECGEPAIGSSCIRYNIRFYRLALVFLVFEVEVVFLFPVAVVLRRLGQQMGWLVFVEVMIFIVVLAIALIYAWRFGSLEWITSPQESEDAPPG